MDTTKESPIAAADAAAAAAGVSEDISQEEYEQITHFFIRTGVDYAIKPQHNVEDSFSNLIGGALKVISIQRGKVSCSLIAKPPLLNLYGGMHGGAVAAVAERVAIGCARTVVAKDKNIFLSELSLTYLSSAPENVEVIVDGSVIKSGRNLTVVAVNFRLKESGQLAYTTHATFYNMPVSSL